MRPENLNEKIPGENLNQKPFELVSKDLKTKDFQDMKNFQNNLLIYIFIFIEFQKQKSQDVIITFENYISFFPHLKTENYLESSFIEGLKDLVQEECCEQEKNVALYHPFLKRVKINNENRSFEVQVNEKIILNADSKNPLVPIEDLVKFFVDERKFIETKLKKPEYISDWYAIIFFLYVFLGKNYLRMKIFDKNIHEFLIEFSKNNEIYHVSQKNDFKLMSSFPKHLLKIEMKSFVLILKHYLKFLRKSQKINWYEISPKNRNLIVEVSINKMLIKINFVCFLEANYSEDLFLFI